MNEMKHFFNTTSVDTIGECLNGEKLLNASRNEKGNTLLTFESAYEGYSDLLKPLHEEDGCDPSEGVVLLFHDKPNAKEPSAELKIVPMVNAEGVPVLSVRVSDLPQQ